MSRIAEIMGKYGGEREPPKRTRRWSCFCCGVQLDCSEELREHLIAEHEEGRDYVLCPIAHCRMPVRDARLHVKTQHPGQEMPKVGQMKASIFRDFSPGGQNKKTRKPRFREGFYESTKMGRQLHYRSGMECKVYECLDADNEILAYEVEPFSIPYIHQGRPHNYTPDIVIRYTDGRTSCVEVKPAAQTQLEKNQDKWHAAKAYCDARGWQFIVLTEVGLDKLVAKVKRQFAEANAGS